MLKRITQGYIPKSLYKYRSISQLKDFLFSGQLYFADPCQFNDPYEGKRSVKAKKRGEDKIVDSELYLLNLGVFCCSSRNDSILMWSHYADSHKGCCIEFDITKDLDFFYGTHEVIYSTHYPQFPPDANAEVIIEPVTDAIFHKSKDWEYEKEYRVVKNAFVGLRDIKPEAIKTIIFGCECKQKDEIIHSLNRFDIYKHIEFKDAKRNINEYKINIS